MILRKRVNQHTPLIAPRHRFAEVFTIGQGWPPVEPSGHTNLHPWNSPGIAMHEIAPHSTVAFRLHKRFLRRVCIVSRRLCIASFRPKVCSFVAGAWSEARRATPPGPPDLHTAV